MTDVVLPGAATVPESGEAGLEALDELVEFVSSGEVFAAAMVGSVAVGLPEVVRALMGIGDAEPSTAFVEDLADGSVSASELPFVGGFADLFLSRTS
jgi:hypothetical protein